MSEDELGTGISVKKDPTDQSDAWAKDEKSETFAFKEFSSVFRTGTTVLKADC